MRNAVERARGLVRKAKSDFAIARLGLRHGEALDMVCFHLQQGIEKLLKALLECRGVEYPPTHNLVALLDLRRPNTRN
jgi:HEPN domain-containing protein